MDTYKLYTDGCCLGNPGPGGVGVCLVFPENLNCENEIFYRGFYQTTNNRMELKAAIEGLKLARKKMKESGYKKVDWLTDSEYVVDGMYSVVIWRKNKWIRGNKEPVLNKDLWQELESVRNSLRIYPVWIPRKENKIADGLAKQGAKNPTHTDFGFVPGRVGTSVGGNKEAPVFFRENDENLKIRIYKGDGQVSKFNTRCKIRFQIVEKDGKISQNKYYAYASPEIYHNLHRHHIYEIEIKGGEIFEIKNKENVGGKDKKINIQ